MNDTDDAQIKTEIDKIMKSVKSIMQKVDALTPKKEAEPENNEDAGENPNTADMSSTESTQNLAEKEVHTALTKYFVLNIFKTEFATLVWAN